MKAPPEPILLSASDVRRLLPMAECVEAMDRAMRATSLGAVKIPPRRFIPLMDDSGDLGLMPGFAPGASVYGAKLISFHGDNAAASLPTIQGLVILFDHDTGTPVAIMEGAEITGIRTAAASGLATRELARQDARTSGILGLGVQAITHVDAMLAVRNIDRFLVWGRSPEKAIAFAEAQSERTGVEVVAASQEEVCGADIVCACTSATEAVLEGRWLKEGAHLNLVGTHTPDAREADADAVAKSSVYVDLLESAHREAGDILMAAEEGAVQLDHIVGEIGRLLEGEIEGRTTQEQITLYKSVGVVSQDLYAADVVYRAALRERS